MRITRKESFSRAIREMDDEDFVFHIAHDAPYLEPNERVIALSEIDRRWNYDGESTDPGRTLSNDKSLELLKELIG